MEKVLLTDICDIQYGYAFDSNLFSDTKGKPLVRIRDVVRGYSETYTTEGCPDNYIVHNGDILIGMDGEFNIALWKGGEAVLNQRVCKLIPHNEICKNYIFYYMPIALKAIEDKTPFVTVKHLSAKELNKIEIPLITYEMQTRIANSLLNLDELIVKRKRQLEKLDELVKARFVELFGDPVTNEKNWPRLTLGDICEIGSSKRVFEKDYVPNGVPFFRTKEIVELSKGNSISTELFIAEEHFEELKKSYGVPKKDDLLISAVGTIGTIWIVSGDFEFYFKDGNLIQIKSSPNFNSIFMKYLLDELIANYKKEMSTGTAYSALTIAGLKKMMVYDVSLAHQEQFAVFVEQVDKSKLEVQKSLEKLELLKKALMQKYFG